MDQETEDQYQAREHALVRAHRIRTHQLRATQRCHSPVESYEVEVDDRGFLLGLSPTLHVRFVKHGRDPVEKTSDGVDNSDEQGSDLHDSNQKHE